MKSVKPQPDPTNTQATQEWLTNEAVAKHKAGDLASAIDYYLQVIDTANKVPDWIYGNTITLLAKVERAEEGIVLGQKALAEYPQGEEIYRAVGIAAGKQGKDDYSVDCYSKAIQINPEQPVWVYYHLIELLTKKKAVDKAIAIGNQGLGFYPDSHWLHYYLGEALIVKEEWDQAIATYIRSLELKSDFTNASQRLDHALENRQLKSEFAPDLSAIASSIELEVKTQGTISAKITEVAIGGILKGWAVDNQDPTSVLKFEVLIDGQAVNVVTTDINIAPSEEDQAATDLPNPPRQFAVKLPIEFLDDQRHTVELIPLSRENSQQQRIKFSLVIPRRGFGVIDLVDNNRLRGWALPDGHQIGAGKLDVYIDNVFYSEVEANLPRPDLYKQGLGNGNNGYDLILPLSPHRDHTFQIGVVFSGTKQHLKRSPIAVKGSITNITSKNAVVAKVTEVALGGILRGWAIDNLHSDRPVKLKVMIDGQAIAIVETTIETTTEYANIPEPYSYLTKPPKSFQVQLPFNLLDNQEHLISLVPVGSDQQSLTPISTRMVIPRRGFGVIEAWTNHCVRGWVLPDGHDGSPAILEVYIDGIFYQEVKANLPRPDLVKHGISVKGENGYKIALPVPPDQQTEYQVEIFFKGTKQNLKKSPAKITYDPGSLKKPFGRFSQLYSSPRPQLSGVTIVIPVYNAYEAVRQCLISVFKHTSRDAKLIIINDASPDERIQPMLATMVGDRQNVRLLTNEENLGYTRTINKAIALAPEDDIILLNSDTSVGPRWLQNLRLAAYQDLDIGTVTAISDNAGAFSVPQIGQANDFPRWLQPEAAARMIQQQSSLLYPETPTGSGFCLYIRRELLNDIGLFDEQAFPRGYGEENDFCMRSLRAGWRHIIDDRTLVYHVRSASFQGEKTALYQPGRAVVDSRYPEYKALVTNFVHSPAMDLMRYQIRKLFAKAHQLPAPRPRVLFVISTQTGGTPQTNQDLMTGLGDRYQPMLLVCDSQEISFYDAQPAEHVLLESIRLKTPINPTSHSSKEYDQIVGDLLFRYGIELVHIRHIAWHSTSLARLAKRLDIPTILSFHDFYTICPTVNLLDENQVFCGGECTATQGHCPLPIWSEYRLPNLKHDLIKTWRHNMAQMFEHIDAFVTTAPSAKEMMVKIYPQLAEANFKVIPHGRDFRHLQNEPTFVLRPPKPHKPLRILFPGNISSAKGAELIVAIKKLDVNNRLEFHFLGRTRHFLSAVGRIHGTYTRDDFDQWMQKIRPHCVGIFSIWPETYCHTLTESWASGVPVVAINKGAVGERITRHGGGWLIDEVDPQAVYQRLLAIANDAHGYIEQISHLHHWQSSYVRQNNIATMAGQYHRLYQQVFAEARPFALNEETNYLRVGVLINEQRPPTAHIRVLEWLQHPDICDRLDVQFLEIDSFLNDTNQVFDLDLILIQRNILHPHTVQPLIDTCRDRNLPIVYEIDDNLLKVPADKDLKGVYARSLPGIKTLATAATEVIVSTEPLAQQMRHFNSQVTVIPNVIAESTWLKPLNVDILIPEALTNLPADTFKVLYMGNSSHGEDLAMIQTVFEQLAQEQVKVKLLVIGGEPEVAENAPDWYTRLSIPQGMESYQLFVPWFRRVARECNLAIAPLVANEFNQYKSPLKFLQYSAVGLPAIYSQVTPYQEVVTPGVNGILVNNSPASWHEAILQCLNDQANLKTIANQAHQQVIKQHLMSSYADAYVAIFANAFSKIN